MRNEEGHIAECIESVLSQDYPRERYEVIVVDGESEDGSVAEVRRASKGDRRVRILSNPKRIVPSAMNVGIRHASGEIIARLDGHTRIEPDYLRVGAAALRRTGADNVGGPMIGVGGGDFGNAVAAAMESRFGIGAYFHFGTEEREVDTVYLGMWPREVFERVGLFDEELVRNQDDEWNYRLRKNGGRVWLIPAMRSRYQNRRNIRSLARQFYQYGLWKVRVLQKHPRQMSWRHFVPPALVGSLAAALVAGGMVPPAGIAGAALAGVYGLAVAATSGYIAARRGWRMWLFVGLAFATMHLAWGTGFLAGLLRFAGRWRVRNVDCPV